MACIMDPDRCVKMDEFYDGVEKLLPSYARPLFVRICGHIEVTGMYFNFVMLKFAELFSKLPRL